MVLAAKGIILGGVGCQSGEGGTKGGGSSSLLDSLEAGGGAVMAVVLVAGGLSAIGSVERPTTKSVSETPWLVDPAGLVGPGGATRNASAAFADGAEVREVFVESVTGEKPPVGAGGGAGTLEMMIPVSRISNPGQSPGIGYE